MKTKKWAKKLSLEVWEYFRDHPEISGKEYLPFYESISNCINSCPLCDLFWLNDNCAGCPLDCLTKEGISNIYYSHYNKWLISKTPKTRAKYAGLIVDKIKAWDIDND